jgi:pyrroloquinoline-quinone synthase
VTTCPVCRRGFGAADVPALAAHLVEAAAASEPGHVRWLNQSISRRRVPPEELAGLLERFYRLPPEGLPRWITDRFVARFFGERPHPFVAALQHPSRATLLGYVIEHQHFLRQWVRSCALILARTDRTEVARYEIDNLRTEFGGDGEERPSHYELLLRMGESYGVPRAETLAFAPLPSTERAIAEWQDICAHESWVAAMAAMHSLELIAHRDLVPYGARAHYFDPAILEDGSITPAARAFLREGYEADVGHAEEALELMGRRATAPAEREAVQSVFLRSIDLFDDYLVARLERAEQYGPTA